MFFIFGDENFICIVTLPAADKNDRDLSRQQQRVLDIVLRQQAANRKSLPVKVNQLDRSNVNAKDSAETSEKGKGKIGFPGLRRINIKPMLVHYQENQSKI